MNVLNKLILSLSSFLQRHFLWLLLGGYVAAALAPGLGLLIKDFSFGAVHVSQQNTHLTMPMLMLALPLLNARVGDAEAPNGNHITPFRWPRTEKTSL